MRREQKEELFKLQTKEFTSYHHKRTKEQQESKESEATRFTKNKVYFWLCPEYQTFPLTLTKERTMNYAHFSHRAIIKISIYQISG